MIVYLNNRFLPEEEATLRISDRGFLYGDGLFETLRIFQGQPFRWRSHWERLQEGTRFLSLPLLLEAEDFYNVAVELASRNAMPEALFRFTISGGSGPRGYARPPEAKPTVVATLTQLPAEALAHPRPWRLIISSAAIASRQPLAAFKTCSRICNVLARTEAMAAKVDEAILLNERGEVAEGAASNIFWWSGPKLQTPPLTSGALPGVTRAVIFELCGTLGITLEEKAIFPDTLSSSDGVFLALSSLGIVAAASLGDRVLAPSDRTTLLQNSYARLVGSETEMMLIGPVGNKSDLR